jgi:hypothetical protein
LYLLQVEKLESDEKMFKDKNKYAIGKIEEQRTLSKLAMINYKYCIATQSCPNRMNILNRCYQSFKPETAKTIYEAGRHNLICKKQKKEVEKCVGGLVMNATRDTCEV